MGKHGVGDLTNNGEIIINLCEVNNLIIGGTIFMHRNIHKLTWTLPDGRTQSQIDHLIINSKRRGPLQDVWVMRNADVGSDHNLLVARMTLKLWNAKIGMARNQRPDISKLKDTLIKEKFKDWNGKKPTTRHIKAEGHTHQEEVQHHSQEQLQHPPT